MTHPKQAEYSKRWYENHTADALERGRQWRKDNPDYQSQYSKEYYGANRESIKEATLRWGVENPEKRRAYRIVRRLQAKGQLQPEPSCSECDREGVVEAHHEDYLEPLEIMWLCRSCHKRLHVN